MLVMDEMMEIIYHYPIGTRLQVEWKENRLRLEGVLDDKYESYNGLAEDEPDYREFYACVLRITHIFSKTNDFEKREGDLIEISAECPPLSVALKDGTVIWRGKE